jgi:uracil-DNA glycosylase family 4
LLTRPQDCIGCKLHDDKIAIGYMHPEGSGSSGVLIVSEALGKHEALEGLPLRPNAPAGSVFQGIIRRIPGLDRSQLLISNTLWCQPGQTNWLDGAPYEYSAIEHCQKYNARLIEQRRPRAIVALGSIPTRTITGMQGHKQGIQLIRGFILDSSRPEYFVDGQPLPVVPTLHPSFLLRASKTRSKDKEAGSGKTEKAEGGMALVGVVRRDIELALEIARNGRPPKPKFETIKGSREVMDELIREAELHPEKPLGWDIETYYSKGEDESEIDTSHTQVTQIQFALDRYRGYVFPGFDTEWVREGTRRLLSNQHRQYYTWNGWGFDDKIVQGSYGIPVCGESVDLMSAWHWIQPDLPKGLQFATSFYLPALGPWKHLLMADDEYYGTCDVITLFVNAEEIFKVMDQRGLRTSYDRHVLMLRPVMVAAQDRGFPIDKDKHEAFGIKIKNAQNRIQDDIQRLIPEETLGLEPKKKAKGSSVPEYGYVRTPACIKESLLLSPGLDRYMHKEQVPIEDDDGNPTEERESREVTYVLRSVEVFNKQTLELEKVLRWCRLRPFSAGSPQQIIRYIIYKQEEEIQRRLAKGQKRADAERLTKYKVPKVRNKQKELKDNTGSKELESLYKATGDEVFRLIIEIKKLKKMYGTYYKGWMEKARDGYVHTTFGLSTTGTGQLSSTVPNIQNCPKHSALGKEFRSCILAKPGRVLLEFDEKSFHAQTLALEAKDHLYARISALDVHSFVTNLRLKLHTADALVRMSDGDMKALFKEQKAEGFVHKQESCVAYPEGMTFQQVRDFKSKRVILGIGFCQGDRTIYEQNNESYKNVKEVGEFTGILKELLKPVFRFQKEISQLAHKQTYLISKWGYIRRFHDVYKWDTGRWNTFTNSYGDWAQGDDYEASVAFLPANDAFGMIKETMLRLAGYRQDKLSSDRLGVRISEDLLARYGFCNQVHDSLFFHCDNALKDECIQEVLAVMRQPCMVLADPEMCPGGFFVDASCSVGQDWSHMCEISA